MVPDAAVLPQVLPTERLQASGMPKPEIRGELRRIPNGHNVLNVASVWLQSFGLLAVAAWIDRWWVWPIAFVLMGRGVRALRHPRPRGRAPAAVLEPPRQRRRSGDGAWPTPPSCPFDLYRRSHFAHHKDEMGPNEPDLGLYRGYPITQASMRRKLTRDAVGNSGLEEPQGSAARRSRARSAGPRPCASRSPRWAWRSWSRS